jgi:hypothetical protein
MDNPEKLTTHGTKTKKNKAKPQHALDTTTRKQKQKTLTDMRTTTNCRYRRTEHRFNAEI